MPAVDQACGPYCPYFHFMHQFVQTKHSQFICKSFDSDVYNRYFQTAAFQDMSLNGKIFYGYMADFIYEPLFIYYLYEHD